VIAGIEAILLSPLSWRERVRVRGIRDLIYQICN